jgi:hypothetical protein
MSTIDDALNRGLSWEDETYAWVKAGLGEDATELVSIDPDGYRQQVRVIRDRDGDVLWIEDESGPGEGDTVSEYFVAGRDSDDGMHRVIEGEPARFWDGLREWARS